MDIMIGSVGVFLYLVFFFQAEDGIRDTSVTGVQTCALPILKDARHKCWPEFHNRGVVAMLTWPDLT